jgi:hypothetical protein
MSSSISILTTWVKSPQRRRQAAERVQQLPAQPKWSRLDAAQRRVLQAGIQSTCRQLGVEDGNQMPEAGGL